MYKYIVKMQSFWDGKPLGGWKKVNQFDLLDAAQDWVSKERNLIGSLRIRRDYKIEYTYV